MPVVDIYFWDLLYIHMLLKSCVTEVHTYIHNIIQVYQDMTTNPGLGMFYCIPYLFSLFNINMNFIAFCCTYAVFISFICCVSNIPRVIHTDGKD